MKFGISVVFSFVAWGIVTRQYIWPALRSQTPTDALRPILLLHSFRFIGLAFLVPGVVSPELPLAFARPAAYGDLATAVLALLAIATLRNRLGIILVWAFNLLGTADLLYAFYQGNSHHSWYCTGLTRSSLLHSNGLGAAVTHYPRSCFSAPLAKEPGRCVVQQSTRGLNAHRAVHARWDKGGPMLFLVELDHVKSGVPLSLEAHLSDITRAEQLVGEK